MAVRVSCTADQRESVGAVRVGCGSVPVTQYMFSRDGQSTLEKDIFLFAYD